MNYDLSKNPIWDIDLIKDYLSISNETLEKLCEDWQIKLSGTFSATQDSKILFVGAGNLLLILLQKMQLDITIFNNQADINCFFENNDPLPFAEDSFDAIVCCGNPPQPFCAENFYLESYRILKKSGVMLAAYSIYKNTNDINIDDANTKGTYQGNNQQEIEILQRIGFSHCKKETCHSIYPFVTPQDIYCITARKPEQKSRIHIIQLTKFKKLVKTTQKQLNLYKLWCQELGFSYTEYSVLHMIYHHKKGAKPTDISSALLIPKQTLSKILLNLEKQDLIYRLKSNTDHRSVFICISEKGKKFLQRYHERLHLIEKDALSELSEQELSLLTDFNDKLLKNLEQSFDKDKRAHNNSNL